MVGAADVPLKDEQIGKEAELQAERAALGIEEGEDDELTDAQIGLQAALVVQMAVDLNKTSEADNVMDVDASVGDDDTSQS